MPTLAIGKATTLKSGPWKSVWDSDDPYDASPDILVDLRNAYIPDPIGGSGIYARPGFDLLLSGAALYTSGTPFRCQAIYSHTQLDGSRVNLLVMAGRLYRSNGTYTAFEDITPAGITIDATISTRVYFASVVGELIVNDGINRPWVSTDPSASTVVGTSIDYDGLGSAWTAYGAPVVKDGAVIMILNEVNGVARRADISWSNAGTPLVGWQQTDFDNNLTLSTNDGGSLYVLVPTNSALYFFRERSIGYLTGNVNTDYGSNPTEDAVAFDVGAQCAGLVQKFGNAVFFGDANGRPNLFQPGERPKDIWKQMRNVVTASSTGFPGTTQAVATSCLETNLNLYCAAIWSPTPSTQAPPTTMVVFDANTGNYSGQFTIAPGIAIECMGNFVDAGGRATMIVAGSKLRAPAVGGYLWAFSGFTAQPDYIASEGLAFAICAEGGASVLVSEGTAANWKDNGAVPDIFAQTDRLGYDETVVLNVDIATVITLTDTPCAVSVGTTTAANVVEGTPTPSPSFDGTYRLVVGCDAMGRGPAVKVSPTTADDQWALERVSLRVIPSLAGPEDA